MNSAWKNDNLVAKGGSIAPLDHPRQDSQHYAHKNLLSQVSPSGRFKNLLTQNYAASSKSQRN